jgi:hypothetical protein
MVKVVFSPGATLARLTASNKRAQQWLDNEVLKDSAPYVPRLTGDLERSGIGGTKIGTGVLVYNTVYASRQYYGNFTHSTQAHPQASRLWFETAKAVNKRKWIAGVRKLGGGGV